MQPDFAEIRNVRSQRSVRKSETSEIRNQQLKSKSMQIKSPKELVVYQKAYALAMEIYRLSKNWLSEEKSHMDRFYRDGRRVKKELHLNLKEALTLADEDIKDNWKAYQEAFMEGK